MNSKIYMKNVDSLTGHKGNLKQALMIRINCTVEFSHLPAFYPWLSQCVANMIIHLNVKWPLCVPQWVNTARYIPSPAIDEAPAGII